MQVLDLIKSAMRLIGALDAGGTLTDDEENDGLATLNDLVDEWSTERLAVFTIPRNVYALTSGKQSYTIGPGATDFNTTRPIRIERAGIITTGNEVQPAELPLHLATVEEWAGITVKATGSSLPQILYNDNANPIATLNFWPYPNVSGVQLALYTWEALTGYSSLTTSMVLAPGYSKALRYNLACDLAPEYGRPLDPTVIQIAIESKAKLKSLAITPQYLGMDSALAPLGGGIFNWITGDSVTR